MLPRTPEPELMNDAEQAAAYAGADFAAPHGAIVAALAERIGTIRGRVLDLGCGPADISARIAGRWPACRVDGIDGAAAMLEEGRARVTAEGLAERVRLHRLHLPDDPLPATDYDLVVSNSLLHHLHDPDVLWRTVADAVAPGGAVFVADLMRPPDASTVDELVERMASAEPEILQRDFRASLHAAFTLDEVRAQLRRNGLSLTVEALDDHHLLAWSGRVER